MPSESLKNSKVGLFAGRRVRPARLRLVDEGWLTKSYRPIPVCAVAGKHFHNLFPLLLDLK